jgi:peptide/nickel transport system substrate-binding protein
MKSKFFAVILCAALLLSLAACKEADTASSTGGDSPSGSDQAGAPSPDDPPDTVNTPDAPDAGKDTLNVAITADDGTLAIEYATTGVYWAMSAVMEPLWDVNEAGENIMVLAESVDQVSDTEYTVHLRQGVTFSNGNPFTASDIIFSYGVYQLAGATGQPRTQTIDPEKTKVIDDNTLDLHLLAPSAAHWQILSQFFIYDEESYATVNDGSTAIGTGPYVVTEYVPNSSIKLERRDDYWGGSPDAKYINFKLLAEPSQRVNALETDLVDISLVALDDVDYAKTLPKYNIDERYMSNFDSVMFNLGPKSKFYHNVEARRAVLHAIDPQALLDVVYLGKGKIMHAAVPDHCFDYEDRFSDMDDTYKIGYNVELAKELAQSSGLAGQTISLMTNGAAEAVKTAEIVQSMVSEIGVTVEINSYDPATAWQMTYDLDAEWDFVAGGGISPNRVVGDQLLNGVRYSPMLTIPGAFDGNMEYLERAPLSMSTVDNAARGEILYDLLGQYEAAAISFGTVQMTFANAYTTAIDMDSVNYSVGTSFVRLQDLRFVS